MRTLLLLPILVFLATLPAEATTVQTAEGNTYDVQTGPPLSPYTALLAGLKAPEGPGSKSFEFRELRYRTKLPFTDKGKLRAEAMEVFERYHKSLGKDFYQEFRDAATTEQRLISMFIWVGSGPTQVKVRGQKDGETFEQRTTPHYYFAVINPAGRQFSPMTYPATEYWVQKTAHSVALPFFRDEIGPERQRPYLNEILGVRDSDNWVAFTLSDITKESVDLRMDVFSTHALIRSELIKGAVRTDLQHDDTIHSYSVRPLDGNSVICIGTTAGMIEYDAQTNVLDSPKPGNTKPSKCL